MSNDATTKEDTTYKPYRHPVLAYFPSTAPGQKIRRLHATQRDIPNTFHDTYWPNKPRYNIPAPQPLLKPISQPRPSTPIISPYSITQTRPSTRDLESVVELYLTPLPSDPDFKAWKLDEIMLEQGYTCVSVDDFAVWVARREREGRKRYEAWKEGAWEHGVEVGDQGGHVDIDGLDIVESPWFVERIWKRWWQEDE
ncbi:hypothetical protein P280DRAFT_514138 [Massarina eburnea CBS 473.64]|uniref:Uncharacterized protein n=1 Tax=Massarina eburnea CBS 473.64 TaxID=1395130 RepID=A0A6A6SE40_9PLEO|nr:hypothetical protein P280DRAFT_514138 [Massarina eburnea CBS 473.64]